MLNALHMTANYSQLEESLILLLSLLLLGSIHAPLRRTKRFEPKPKILLIFDLGRVKVLFGLSNCALNNLLNVTTRDQVKTGIGLDLYYMPIVKLYGTQTSWLLSLFILMLYILYFVND